MTIIHDYIIIQLIYTSDFKLNHACKYAARSHGQRPGPGVRGHEEGADDGGPSAESIQKGLAEMVEKINSLYKRLRLDV